MFAPANKDKLAEIEAFINEKYMASQIGAIRDKIWKNVNAIGLTPKDKIPAMYFEVIGGKGTKLANISEVDVQADGIYNKMTGDNKIPFKQVQDQNRVCKIEFNKATSLDLTTLVDGIREKLCCINITMDGKNAHLCAQNSERCQH